MVSIVIASGAVTGGEILSFLWWVAVLLASLLVLPGLVAAALSLPCLWSLGYGLCPRALAPAVGGDRRRAAVAHLLTGVLLVVGYVLLRVVLYLGATVAGIADRLPPFGATTVVDVALPLALAAAVWYRYSVVGTGPGERIDTLRTLAPYLAYVVALVPAVRLVRWLLVWGHPWVGT